MKGAVNALMIFGWFMSAFLLFFTGSVVIFIINHSDGWGALILGIIAMYAFFISLLLCIPMIIFVKKLTLKATKVYVYSTLGNVLLSIIMFVTAMFLL